MKRSKQLIRNSCVIFVILFFIYYFGGFYFSKEECIDDTLRALYGNETVFVEEYEFNNLIYTIMTHPENKTLSIVGTRRIGFLYKSDDSIIGQKMDDRNSIFITGMYSNDRGVFIVVYRNHPSVNKVVAYLDDGSEITFDEWNKDFSIVNLDRDDWHSGKYKVYDASNNFMEEMKY